MPEAWKDVPGYEGLYQVSSAGRVKSLTKGVIMSCYISGDGSGYKRVKLSDGHGKKEFLIHRLVAVSFIPNTDNLAMRL